MDSYVIQKLSELVKRAYIFKEVPQVICQQSRVSCESILREIYKKEVGELPKQITFDPLLKGIVKAKPKLIPSRIEALFTTVQIYGNLASHPQDDLDEVDSTHAEMIEKALGRISNWFFNEYLNVEMDWSISEPQGPLLASKNDKNQNLQHYRELVLSALSDQRLELDEYESLLTARENLELDHHEASQIEREVCLSLLGKQVNDLRDILSSIELVDFLKFERTQSQAAWLTCAIDAVLASENPEWRSYVSRYLPQVAFVDYPLSHPIVGIIGAWQGWYAQFESKTYFDLFFVAMDEETIIGLSMEPANPNWKRSDPDAQILWAEIHGAFLDDLIFQFRKTYLFKEGWSIDYNGVILDNGRSFEGEWSAKKLHGPFNALKSKSLLPIRIFDTTHQYPIVPSIYLDQLRMATGTYLVQLQGRSMEHIILHILQTADRLHVNLLAPVDGMISFRYASAKFSRLDNMSFEVSDWKNDPGGPCTFNISLDLKSHTLSGVVKDEVHRIRALKGTIL